MSVVRDSDAAGVDVERIADPARPLQVRVTAREQRRVVAEEGIERLAAELGQKHVVVGARRAVEEEQGHAVELAANDRREGADLLELGRRQLRKRPVAHLELPLGDRLRRVVVYLEEERIGVAEHRLAAESRKAVERLRGLRAALHGVAEADDLRHAEQLDVLERGSEGDVVPVLVGDEREAHGQSSDLTAARPARTRSGWSVKTP